MSLPPGVLDPAQDLRVVQVHEHSIRPSQAFVKRKGGPRYSFLGNVTGGGTLGASPGCSRWVTTVSLYTYRRKSAPGRGDEWCDVLDPCFQVASQGLHFFTP
ncbi:hypothetical protein LCGC14_2314710 [marine sediment metagenome]|uniref:Uncharacterized protein n=1 Tax=marine sediment metagenome TaxID=412755 RepID=A0A0F9CK64_9ZZZZ